MKTWLLVGATMLLSASPAAAAVMTFDNLGGEYASRYSTYTENGFTFTILNGYATKASTGDPTPPGVVSYGFNNLFELTAGGSAFTFQGFGLAVQTSFNTIYRIAGTKDGTDVFSYSGSQAGTESRFIFQNSASNLLVDRVTLTFDNYGRVQGASTIDNVSSTLSIGTGQPGGPAVTSAVPEPASWAMMIGGFGLIGGSQRRRRRIVATVSLA